ncbi:MAG: ElyC/SanA/YdcF family protein [Eggerthellaceae bacterium]|jgi:SanA protein
MKHLLKFIGTLIVLVAAVFAISNAVVLATTASSIVDEDQASSSRYDAIIVLGASVLPDGTPSPILRDRLDTAAQLYFDGVSDTVIVSGDNVTYNESLAMKKYLVNSGIPDDSVVCDLAGIATYDSMYRAVSEFGIDSACIVTQRYHLPRALYSARGLGIDAVGVPADRGSYSDSTYYELREIPARTKDFFKTLLHEPADFAGNSNGNLEPTSSSSASLLSSL